MSNEYIGSFELETELNFPKEKIIEFFKSKSIKILKIQPIEQNKKTMTNYIITFECTQESLSGLELIKCQGLYDNNNFKINKLRGTNAYIETAKKLIEEEKTKRLIEYPVKYEDQIRKSFMKCYVKDGIEFINQDILKKQRSVMSYMLKKIGGNILTGKRIMNVSLPIYIFDCRSMLEAFAYGYKLSPLFLDKEAPQGNLERLKISFTLLVSQLHTQLGAGKPFNPIIGETFQAKVGKSSIYIEQTSHHPPIYNYYVKHPHFTTFGYSEMEAVAGANSMTATNVGKFYLRFNDGILHRFYAPKFCLKGLAIGKRYMNFEESIRVEDITNGLTAVVNINEDDRGMLGKLFTSKKTFPDYFTGFIANTSDVIHDPNKNTYRLKSDNSALAKIEGEWSRYLKIDDKEYWRQGECELPNMEKMEFMLPSDSSLREDIILLKHGYEEYAQEAKTYLEEIQRNDRNLREKFKATGSQKK